MEQLQRTWFICKLWAYVAILMKIFSDILKPEEQLSGFTPGEPDDDIFMLGNDNEYTAEIPEFKEDTPIQDNTTIVIDPKVDNTIYEAPSEGNVWDIFENEPTDEVSDISSIENMLSDDEETLSSNKIYDDEEEDLSSEPIENSSEDDAGYLFGDEVEIIKDERINDFDDDDESAILSTEPTDNIDSEEIPASDEVILDPEFLASLKKDLDKVTPPKTIEKTQNIVNDDKPLFEDKEVDNSIFIDITGMKVGDSPSTYGIINSDDSQTSTNVQSPASKSKGKKADSKFDASDYEGILNEKEIKKKQKEQEKLDRKLEKKLQKEEKEKNKKPLAWRAILTSAAVFVLLSLLGTGGYYFWQSEGLDFFASKEKSVEETIQQQEVATSTIEKTDNLQTTEAKKDAEQKAEEPISQTESIAEAKPETKPEAKPEATAPAAPQREVSPQPKRNETAPAKPTPQAVKPEPKRTAPQQPTAAQQKQTPARQTQTQPKQPIATKQTQPKQPIATKQTQPTKQESTAKPTTTQSIARAEEKLPTFVPSDEEVYTVQIYSTPSIEDAESWLRQLTTRQITDGYISTQKIREQTWYRVRFGKFATRDEARAAAQKHGFSQSWVDRIK